MNISLIFMIPIAFLTGVLLHRILNADIKITSRTKINRDYFHIPFEESAEESGQSEWLEPEDDTHSVILEVVEKCWKRLFIFDSIPDLDKPYRYFFIGIGFLVSVLGLTRELTGGNDSYGIPVAWMEKLWVALKPYGVYIYGTFVAVIVVWLVGTWVSKRLRLLKDVRNRAYHYEIYYRPDPDGEDAILEVAESNAPDYIHIRIYFNRGWRFAPFTLKVERQMQQS